jgi:dTDP-4-amino-4,6-dideoxygalactose transaminase
LSRLPNFRSSIPLVDLKAQRQAISAEIETAIARVVERCDFILGEEVSLFESDFAEYCGVPYAIGVANGTDALHLACRARWTSARMGRRRNRTD